MNQQPDKLFREKLEGLHLEASSNAWARVEANLHPKSAISPILKIAAAVLLIATAAFIILDREATQPDSLATIADPGKKPVTTQKSTPGRSATILPDNSSRNDAEPETKEAPLKKKRGPQKQKSQPTPMQNINTGYAYNDQQLASLEKPDTVNGSVNPIATTTIDTAEPARLTKASGVKILYTSSEANKYLDKSDIAQATPEGKKESTLKRVLDKAYDLTTNADPIGDLRQMKDQILARNFRNEKERSQNR